MLFTRDIFIQENRKMESLEIKVRERYTKQILTKES